MRFKFLSVPCLTLASFLRYQSILWNLILLVSVFDWACTYWMDRQGNYKGWDHDGETRRGRALQDFAVLLSTFFFFHEKHQYFLHLKPQLLHNLVTWHWKWQRAHLLLLDSYTAALIITYLFIIENLSLTANIFMLNFMVTLSWIHLPQSSHYSWMLIYHNCQILTIMLR